MYSRLHLSHFGTLWIVLFLVGFVPTSAHAILTPVGDEQVLNITTANAQTVPELAFSPSGSFQVAVWASDNQDGDGQGVFARFGGALTEVQVNQTVVGHQSAPHLSISNIGQVVIVWQGDDPADDSIFARVFTPAGTPITGEFLIENLVGQQQFARVAHFPNGNFAVVWQNIAMNQLMMRGFDSIGSPITPHQIITPMTTASGADVAIGPNNIGIVSYRASLLDEGVYYRMVDPSGSWVTPQIQADQTVGDAFFGTAASASNGRAYLSWVRRNADGTNTFLTRAVALNGIPLTPETEVVTVTAPLALDIDLSHDDAGRGALAWSESDGGAGDVYIHCLDGSNPAGTSQLVNTTTLARQRDVTVCHDNLGGLIVGWHSVLPAPDDCFAQQFVLGSVSGVDQIVSNESSLATRTVPSVFATYTTLSYRVERATLVETGVFDVFGRKVRSWDRVVRDAGEFAFSWDGENDRGQRVPAGTYWFRVRSETEESSSRIVLLR